MQAILVKQTRDSNGNKRLSASAAAGRVSLSWDSGMGDKANFDEAARKLAHKFGWTGTYHAGVLGNGDVVYVAGGDHTIHLTEGPANRSGGRKPAAKRRAASNRAGAKRRAVRRY